MRFELTVALKYLIPRWRQLSVSIISLLSVVVISLVVWLVVLFLSVTEGIEKRWIDELVSFNAPLKILPTDEYYHSYYYQIDNYSLNSNYMAKSIGEKMIADQSDPYDPSVDMELSDNFPPPDLHSDGSLKDPVKEAWAAILSLSQNGSVRPQEYEVTFGNLRLNLFRDDHETYLNQVCYVSSFDKENKKIQNMLLPYSPTDFQNLLQSITTFDGNSPSGLNTNLSSFFEHLDVQKVQTSAGGFVIPSSLYPQSGAVKGIALLKNEEVFKVILPNTEKELSSLESRLNKEGFKTTTVQVQFEKGGFKLAEKNQARQPALVLDEKIPLQAKFISGSLQNVQSLKDLKLQVSGKVQQIAFSGMTPFKQLEFVEVGVANVSSKASSGLWVAENEGKFEIPRNGVLGEGVLIAKHFQKNGVHLGDRGHLSYYSPSASSIQEQRIPIFVAGFYDPGMLPLGNKLIFVDPNVTALLRTDLGVSDNMLGNGINIWLNQIKDAEKLKSKLSALLEEKGIAKYWEVQSYQDYEFSRPILQQLKSDKNLFTLIALIILIVACSNVISMLILLVNDKKKEIGIMQSMGASPKRIAAIFGVCGFTMGLVSCILGIAASFLTLRYLQSLLDFLSLIQGHEIFQSAFYGHGLPNQISAHSVIFVTIATLLISLLAGLIPAIKAARIRPTEILRSE